MQRIGVTSYVTLTVVATCFVVIALDRAGLVPQLRPLTTALYSWTILLAAFALILGVANVALVHLRRVYTGQRDWGGSLALLVTLFAVLLAGLLDRAGATNPFVEWIFDAVIAPGQATMYALLAFFMAAAAYRYLRIGRAGGLWMLFGVLTMMLAQLPIVALPPTLRAALHWLLLQPVMVTFRGVLLGSGLALVVIGIRFLLGRTEVQ